MAGEIDYKEFVVALARDTVVPAALGKNGTEREPTPMREPTPEVVVPRGPSLREMRLQRKAFDRQQRAAEAMVGRLPGQ